MSIKVSEVSRVLKYRKSYFLFGYFGDYVVIMNLDFPKKIYF